MDFDVPLGQLVGFMLATIRVIGWFLLAPPFSHKAIPVQVKIMLALGVSLAVQPAVPEQLVTSGITEGYLMVAAAQELLVGGALGFLCLVIYYVVQAAGSIIDMLGGFMMAFTFDPQLGAGMSTIGRFYHLTALALLFATNSHLLILRGVLSTYELLPIGELFSMQTMLALATDGASRFLVAALQIAGPLMAVLFLTDVGMGLMVRIAPQLNLLMLIFPLKVGVTLLLLAASFAGLPRVIELLTEQALDLMVSLVRS